MNKTYEEIVKTRPEMAGPLTDGGFPLSVSLVEFVKFQFRYIASGINLGDGELTLLAYVYLYDDFMEKFMADGHSRSKVSVGNYVTRLKKEGLMISTKELNPDLVLTKDPSKFIYYFVLND